MNTLELYSIKEEDPHEILKQSFGGKQAKIQAKRQEIIQARDNKASHRTIDTQPKKQLISDVDLDEFAG